MSMSSFHKPYLALNSLIGKQVLFFNHSGDDNQRFGYSSTLDKIGHELDVSLKNNTVVLVISEPVVIDVPKYGGMISVTKIRADVSEDYHTIVMEFWVPTITLVEIVDERQVPVVH
jgi:hypothetical protein